MFDRIKNWINQSLTGTDQHHDLEHLPTPKVAAEQRLEDIRLIVLDLETTGLNFSKDQVIAIGAVAINRLEIPLRDQFDLVLRRPELDISETVLIHGICPEALTRGHETEDALLHLLEWMNGDPILAFHSAFDQKFLEKSLKQTLGYTRPHLWMDVADLLPVIFRDTNTGDNRLDNWADHFQLEVSERHNAAADAMVTAELTLIALNRALKTDTTTLEQLATRLKYHKRLRALRRQ